MILRVAESSLCLVPTDVDLMCSGRVRLVFKDVKGWRLQRKGVGE